VLAYERSHYYGNILQRKIPPRFRTPPSSQSPGDMMEAWGRSVKTPRARPFDPRHPPALIDGNGSIRAPSDKVDGLGRCTCLPPF